MRAVFSGSSPALREQQWRREAFVTFRKNTGGGVFCALDVRQHLSFGFVEPGAGYCFVDAVESTGIFLSNEGKHV